MNPASAKQRLSDPIVEEVRAIREALDAEVGHDVAKLAERARQAGEAYRRQQGLEPVELPEGGGEPIE